MVESLGFPCKRMCIEDEARSWRVVTYIQIISYHSTLANTNAQLLQSFRDQGGALRTEQGVGVWCAVNACCMRHVACNRFLCKGWCIEDEARSWQVVIQIQIIPYHSTLARTNVQRLQSFRDQGGASKTKQGVGMWCVWCVFRACCTRQVA
jgi:hypothetical protein